MPKKKVVRSGPSGAHRAPRRPLSGSDEQFTAWDSAAQRAGLSWADWARASLDASAKKLNK